MASSRIASCLFAFFVCMPWLPLAAQESRKPADFVHQQAGDCPIILTAPHGGTLDVPDVPERKGDGLEKGGKGFVAVRDGNTDLLAAEIARQIEKTTGKKPYVVIAKFHRKYIDANRPPEIGYESKNAKPVYDEFHGAVSRFCKEVQRKHGRGLLLDIHGQALSADTIYRGTQNGKTVQLLRQRFGDKAHDGQDSFFGRLAAHGARAHPLDGGPEQKGYTGGHIVGTYGSHQGYAIDAIQLEFGNDYRLKKNLEKTAKIISLAVRDYSERYLGEK